MVEWTSDMIRPQEHESTGARESGRPTGLEVVWFLLRFGLFAVGAYAVLGLTIVFDHDAEARSAYFWFFIFISAAILLSLIGALLLMLAWRSLGIRGARVISWALTLLAPVCALHHVGPLALAESVDDAWENPAAHQSDHALADTASHGTYLVVGAGWALDDWVTIDYRSPWTLGCARTIAVLHGDKHDLFPGDVSLQLTEDALQISVKGIDHPLSIPREEIGWLLLLGPRAWHGDELERSFSWSPFDAVDSLLILAVVVLLRRKIRQRLLLVR